MPETNAQLLGQLIEAVNGIRRDIDNLRSERNEYERSASASRKDLHDRIDETIDRFNKVENTTILASQIVAQTRDVVDALKAKVDQNDTRLRDEVMPIVRTVQTLEGMGKRWLIAAAVAGASVATGVGTTVITNWDGIWQFTKTHF